MFTIKKYPWDSSYYKIIFKIPLTNYTITWSKYADGWFGLRINK